MLGVLGTLPLWGRSLHAGATKRGLRAGAARANITLPIGAVNGGVILRGQPVKHVHDELYARCLVLDDGTTPLAVVVCDLRMIRRELIDRAKEMAATTLGWPVANMLVAATHTHSAPGLVGIQQEKLDRWYEELVVVRIADSIRRAAAELAPAQIGWGSVAKPEHVFNRRRKIRPGSAPPNPFGDKSDLVVTNAGPAVEVLDPAGPVDPELSILSIRRENERPLAVLANYGLHYVGGGTGVSADYFGMFADRLGRLLGADDLEPPFVGIMSNGASGDVNNVDRLRPRQRPAPFEKMRLVADDLARAAAKVCGEISYRPSVALGVATKDLPLMVRKPDASRLDWARRVVQGIHETNNLSRVQVYAEEALALDAGPAEVRLPLQAICIDELGIAACPCEVFAETGLEIKRKSPLRPTFVIELANAYGGYPADARATRLGRL